MIPTNAYRIFTVNGVKQLHYIDPTGSVLPLVPLAEHKKLPDGYYTPNLKPIKVKRDG